MKILLVTPTSPFDYTSGSSQRTSLLHESIRRFADVDVLLMRPGTRTTIHDSGDPRIAMEIEWKPRTAGITTFFSDRTIRSLVDTRLSIKSYDVVVGRYLSSLAKLDFPRGLPTIVDLDDAVLRYTAAESFAYSLKSMPRRIRASVRRLVMLQAMKRFSYFFFPSERDRTAIPHVRGEVLPNIPWSVPQFVDPATDGQTLLFVGSLWYPPNFRGIKRFLARIWPAVRKALPDARLRLVGEVDEALRRNWNAIPGVTAPGFVADISSEYGACACTIAPIYEGGGTNIKVLESFANGRACITTDFCYKSFCQDLDEACNLRVARNDDEFIGACVEMLVDKNQREARAEHGRKVIQERFSRDRFGRIVEKAIRDVTY